MAEEVTEMATKIKAAAQARKDEIRAARAAARQ
jgi:hypothetical protein